MADKQLHAKLARYMDPGAYEPIPNCMKHTCANVATTESVRRKRWRQMSEQRARAAVRFFLKPENLARLNAQAASTPHTEEDQHHG